MTMSVSILARREKRFVSLRPGVWAVADFLGRESQFSLSVWLTTVHWRPHNQKYMNNTYWSQWVINVYIKEGNKAGGSREMQDMAVNRINVHHNKFPKG